MDAILAYLFGGISIVVLIGAMAWTLGWWLFKGPDKKP